MSKAVVPYQSAMEIRSQFPALEDQVEYHSRVAALRVYRPTPQIAIAEIEAQAAMAETVRELRKNGALADEKTPGPGRGKKSKQTVATLATVLGLSKNPADHALRRWKAVQAIPAKERARFYGSRGKGLASRAGLIRWKRDRDQRPKEAPSDPGIAAGDFRTCGAQLEDGSTSLIFTDPPYDRKSLHLYGSLFDLAARVLKPGGSLMAYAGHYALPDILKMDLPGGLRFWWCVACVHTGGRRTFPGKYVFVGWKPILWFVNGTERWDSVVVRDVVISERPDKSAHEWSQSEVEATYYIEHLTDSDELVVDPMCGDGTTLVAAKKLNRHYAGIEIDKERAADASRRLRAASDQDHS